MKNLSDNLLIRLQNADVVCKDCGAKYGKYSVGCSSTWVGECNVCEETKPVTEVRDYGYLAKGITDEKERMRAEATANKIFNEVFTDDVKSRIKQQSAEVANYMKAQEELASQEEDEPASYEEGDIVCKFTEAEIAALAQVIEDHAENYPPGANVDYDSAFEKIMDLYDDNCVKYELSPALKAYHEKYGTWGTGEDEARWEGFRDAFLMLEGGK